MAPELMSGADRAVQNRFEQITCKHTLHPAMPLLEQIQAIPSCRPLRGQVMLFLVGSVGSNLDVHCWECGQTGWADAQHRPPYGKENSKLNILVTGF